jgi:hypothetical protein
MKPPGGNRSGFKDQARLRVVVRTLRPSLTNIRGPDSNLPGQAVPLPCVYPPESLQQFILAGDEGDDHRAVSAALRKPI